MSNRTYNVNDKVVFKNNRKYTGKVMQVLKPQNYDGTYDKDLYYVLWNGFAQNYIYFADALISEKEAEEIKKAEEKSKPIIERMKLGVIELKNKLIG